MHLNTNIFIPLLAFVLFVSTGFTQPDAQSYYDLGLRDIKSKDYVKAIGDFTNAVSMRSNYAEAYFQRAKAKILLGEQMGFVNAEACADLVSAMRYGNMDAVPLLEKNCMGECFDNKFAFEEPEMVFCGDFNSKLLHELPSNISDLTNIIKLNLFNNKFSAIPDVFSSIYTLLSLDMSSNNITSINQNISKLTLLRELNLNKNKIAKLPTEIGNLGELKHLYLRNNDITEIPNSIGKMRNLEDIDLSFNKLISLPIEIGNLKRLKTLNLVGNEIPKSKQDDILKLLPNAKVYFE